MKLDTDEVSLFELKPEEKILIPWFFSKTIVYSFAIVFFGAMAVYFIDFSNSISFEAVAPESSPETPPTRKPYQHPYTFLFEHWAWALLILTAITVPIQLYFVYLRRTYHYHITNKRCIFIGGILKRVERSVPYMKVTDIQRSQNLLERFLGIWNVQVFTPGTASIAVGQRNPHAEINFDGLSDQQSEDVLAALNKHIQLS